MFVEKLETQELIITHPDNESGSIVAFAKRDGVGLWLTQGKRMISVYNLKDEVAIGIYADKYKAPGLSIALSINQNNEPEVQLVNSKDEVKKLTFEDFK